MAAGGANPGPAPPIPPLFVATRRTLAGHELRWAARSRSAHQKWLARHGPGQGKKLGELVCEIGRKDAIDSDEERRKKIRRNARIGKKGRKISRAMLSVHTVKVAAKCPTITMATMWTPSFGIWPIQRRHVSMCLIRRPWIKCMRPMMLCWSSSGERVEI